MTRFIAAPHLSGVQHAMISAAGWEVAVRRRPYCRGVILRPLPHWSNFCFSSPVARLIQEVFFMNSLSTRRMVTISILMAIEIILSRFLYIPNPIVKFTFAFLPVALMGLLYGPWWAGLAAAVCDLIGALLFPIGAYFPGFTLTAFLTGVVYGLLLYNRPLSWIRIGLAVLIIAIVLNLGLDTLWIGYTTGKGYIALFPTRILKTIFWSPVQILCIGFLHKALIRGFGNFNIQRLMDKR